jgi:hypothetical protein
MRRIYRLTVVAALVLIAVGLAGLLWYEPFGSDHSSGSSQAAPLQSPYAAVGAGAGNLDRLVDEFVEALSNRRVYRAPTPRQAAILAQSYRELRAGKLRRAAKRARPLGYGVVRYRDRATGRRLVMLIERRNPRRGWGLYVHSPRSRSRLMVEVAHPRADLESEHVGVGIFRRANASDLFVAGAHRYASADGSSDAAHTRRAIVLQPHGFDEGERGARYGEIVISSGEAPTGVVNSLGARLTARGFKTCVYRTHTCEALGGTKNVQGQSARAAGALFIHLELAFRLRERAAVRDRLVSTIAAELR